MSTIALDGYNLAYTTEGPPNAPPLLMIHGFMSHRGVWQQTVEVLKDSYCCVTLDLLGFGESDKPEDGDYSLEAQGQRILHLADVLGFEEFSLVGHSMGGQIALSIAALLASERVTKLVSVAGIVSGTLTPVVEGIAYPQVALGAAFPGVYTLWRYLARYPWCANAMFRAWFHRMDAVPFERWEVDRVMAFQPGVHVSAYEAAQSIHHLNLTAHLPKITAPTLAIFGRQDNVVPISDGFLIKQHVLSSQLVLIDECGHYPMYEQAQQYLDALCAFLLD